MGELIVFIVVFYVIGKILKAIFGGYSKSDYHHDRKMVIGCLPDFRIRICMFFMFLSFYRGFPIVWFVPKEHREIKVDYRFP